MADILANKETIKKRLNACGGCEFYTNGWCGRVPVIGETVTVDGKQVELCGCKMILKTMFTDSQCPLNKWE